MFLVNSRLALVTAASSSAGREVLYSIEAPLIPKLRGHFAEFLNQSYLALLSILYLSTCVGLGYGHHMNSPLGFSWQHRISHFDKKVSASYLRINVQRIFLSHSLRTYPRITITWDDLPSCVPLRLPCIRWVVSLRRAAT